MAIAFINLGNSNGLGDGGANTPDINDDTDASAYSNTSWTPPTSGLILLSCWGRLNVAGSPNAPTVAGNSVTWVQIATAADGSRGRMTLFGADASGSATGVTTITYTAQTLQCQMASFFQATGVDLSSGVLAAFVQATTTVGSAASASLTLAAAGDAANRPVSSFNHRTGEVTTPRTNWTELDDFFDTTFPARGFETQQRDDTFEVTASASWATSSGFVGIAAELKAAAVGGRIMASLVGAGGLAGMGGIAGQGGGLAA